MARLATGLAPHAITYLVDPSALIADRRLRSLGSMLAALVDVDPTRPDEARAIVGRIRESAPDLPLAVLATRSDDSLEAIRDCVHRFGTGMLVADRDDTPERAWPAILRVVSLHVADRVRADIGPVTPSWFVDACVACIEHAFDRLSANRLARLTGLPYATLYRKLRRQNLPKPLELIHWSRILVAAWVLNRGAENVTQVVAELGLRTTRSFRKAVRKRSGWTPNELRRYPETFALTTLAFRRRVALPPSGTRRRRSRPRPNGIPPWLVSELTPPKHIVR